jgi:L-fucose isomerase-like protein
MFAPENRKAAARMARQLSSILWVLIGIAVFAVAGEVTAQTLYLNETSVVILDGEPTDPERALVLLSEAGADLESRGIRASVPQAEAERKSWWEEIVNLLRVFGILPPEEPGR